MVQLSENKIINLDEKISTLKSEFFDKVLELKQKLKVFEQTPDPPHLQNEQFFRSMLLSLKNDINNLKEENENSKKYQILPQMPLENNLEQNLELKDLQDPSQLNLLKSILRQHDTAIRVLANKIIPIGSEDRKPNESALHLNHLEDLKKEMKEILAKQEESKKLSNKDLEIIQNILNSLDSKIGREDLSQMAEKNELQKIYRMLKKRIDELAFNIKKKEISPKEEAFFLRKKFGTECASCGQVLQEKLENKLIHENWNKFPVKNSTYCIGFSRILNSLVQSPTGGLMLPKAENKSTPDDLRPLKNKKINIRKAGSRVSIKKIL